MAPKRYVVSEASESDTESDSSAKVSGKAHPSSKSDVVSAGRLGVTLQYKDINLLIADFVSSGIHGLMTEYYDNSPTGILNISELVVDVWYIGQCSLSAEFDEKVSIKNYFQIHKLLFLLWDFPMSDGMSAYLGLKDLFRFLMRDDADFGDPIPAIAMAMYEISDHVGWTGGKSMSSIVAQGYRTSMTGEAAPGNRISMTGEAAQGNRKSIKGEAAQVLRSLPDRSRVNKLPSSVQANHSNVGTLISAPDNHPIFGVNGIMRGFMMHSASKRLQLKGEFVGKEGKNRQNSPAVFGDNNLAVGTVWPRLLAVMRDGGHGCSQQGIFGTAGTGAYSIIVAKGKLNDDDGDELMYASRECNGDKSMNMGALTLWESFRTGKEVRVVRNNAGKWSGRPKLGYRYDGLYKVVQARDVESKNKDGKVTRMYGFFKLVRVPGQAPIDQTRPNPAEIALFKQVKDAF